jgi:hypothetical protein
MIGEATGRAAMRVEDVAAAARPDEAVVEAALAGSARR